MGLHSRGGEGVYGFNWTNLGGKMIELLIKWHFMTKLRV